MTNYIFTSARLGFRNWKDADLDSMATINADEDVMEYFPSTQSREITTNFIERMQKQFAKNGFCYFAVDILETNEFIGFIGLSKQEYDARFETPFVDIGWRLSKSTWNKGYATEGAKRCLKYAFETLKLETIYSIATSRNIKSMRIMEKIGMEKHSNFMHPYIANDSELKKCIAYKIDLSTT
ncbi:MAG: GNAT family N-acetyltransferase [Flavobacteriaceae bacterium]|nr:GNAT family N-acetyltransferase [Flavobacteriaceae bacterium]